MSEGDTGTENKENLTVDKPGSKPGSRPGSRSNSAKQATIDNVEPPLQVTNNPSGDLRNMRRIIAEDPEWSLTTVPLLVDLCTTHIVTNFANNSKLLNDLKLKDKQTVLKQIATELPLKVTALLVEDKGYWKRCCKGRWNICDISAHGNSWKQMYFERNMQHIVEHFVPESTDPTELNESLMLSQNFIKKLDIRQLLPPVKEAPKGLELDDDDAGSDAGDEPETDHFDFGPVLVKLPHLVEFRVCFGVKDCGMNFEWNLFQFTARDCLLLSKCIAACKTLQVFSLHRSKVDDDKVRVLISHVLDHPGLTELDLSHNMISDRGARAIGKFLNNHSKLVKLSVADNQIRALGAQAIAHALTKNTTLEHIDLRLNRLGDEGGQAICRALLKNSTLKHVNLGSNDMTEPTALILSRVVVENTVLKTLDLSCNRLGNDGGKQLQEGMDKNTTLTVMDLRLTECGQESEYCINQILHKNIEKERAEKLNKLNQAK